MGKSAMSWWTPVGLGAATLVVLLASAAWADIYHYVDDEGTHHFTSYRVRGMELVEVIRSPSPGNRSSSPGGQRRSTPTGTGTLAPSRSYDDAAFDAFIREASETFAIPFEFIKAVIRAESAFNPRAVSRAGAQGLMQLMPGTASDMGVTDSFDPRQNILGGTRYLRILADRFSGDINLVLAGYNAGPGAVEEADGIPYEDTRRYIETVYRYYQEYLTN